MTGTLALVGGGEFRPGCEFDRELLAAAGTDEVLVLPTGAAFEHPERVVAAAVDWFAGLGAKAEGLMAVSRPDAFRPEHAERVRTSRFTYLTGSSPMHLRSVLKDTPLWQALGEALDGGGCAGRLGRRRDGALRPDGRPTGRRLHRRARPRTAGGRRAPGRGVVRRPPAPHARPRRGRRPADRAVHRVG